MWVFQVDSSINTLVLTDLISYSYQTTIIYANNIKVNCYTIWNLNYWNENEKKSQTHKSVKYRSMVWTQSLYLTITK